MIGKMNSEGIPEISVDIFSKRSIENAKKKIQQYRDSLIPTMDSRVYKLLDKIMDRMRVETQRNLEKMNLPEEYQGFKGTVTTSLVPEGSGLVGRVFFDGVGVAFIEFGTGITYNDGVNHPRAGATGFYIGSWNPYSSNATNPNGWFYTDPDGLHKVHTYGVKAQAPLYDAFLTVREEIPQIAKEIFRV